MKRINRIRKLISEYKVDALFLSSASNVFYVSGFRSTNAFVIILEKENIFITDSRYYERAKELLKGWSVYLLRGSPKYLVNSIMRERDIRCVAFEKDRITVSFFENIKLKGAGIEWIGISEILKSIRSVKDMEEIKRIREAVSKTDKVYRKLIEDIKEGMSEKELRSIIVTEIFKEKGEGESFPAIVAFREGSAIPHWETSDRRIESKGALLIDMGIVYKGYCSDFTRTLYMGKSDDEFRKVYETVREAHLRAVDFIKEGVRIGDIDKIAREYIENKGYGDYFIHSTGHGIGIDIHEYPRIYYKGRDSRDCIKEGMVFTIEPGIYIKGKFGVRLENIVVAYNSHAEPLSSISLDLLEI